jgi:hypothetical protein
LSPIDVARMVDVAVSRQSGVDPPRNLREPNPRRRLQRNTMTKRRIDFERTGHRPSRQCSGEFMKLSNSLIAAALVVALPLGAFAGDKDKTQAPMGTAAKAQFDMLDTNRDGRISAAEASSDSKIVFSTADKNGDGYLDGAEYSHRDMVNDSMPRTDVPASDTEKPRN